ncbi:MAG TPA: HU family DNA-binding protein [Candidatus Coproplasma avistercoris]|nr:HU family DNA-binding protein [Candidatus Coproplasma avistercoris]
MNKSEFVAKLAEDTGLKKGDAEKFLDAFVANVKAIIADGDKLQLVGFGTFEAKERGERTGKNPLTGETITIAACKVPSFKPGKGFKDELNK